MPLLWCASQQPPVLASVVAKMEKQLDAIPALRLNRLGKREPRESRQVVSEALWRSEANGIPTRIAHILEADRVSITGTQDLIVLGTLLAVSVVGEVLRASAFRKRLLNCLKYLGIGWHRCVKTVFVCDSKNLRHKSRR